MPENNPPRSSRVCPASGARFLATGLRRLFQNPDKILAGLIEKGQTVADIGCGPGFFTMAMAKAVGEEGCVIAVDLQEAMLEFARRRAEQEGLSSRIRFHRSGEDRIGIEEKLDFALAFYMIHEVPNREAFLREIHGLLKPGGRLLVVEPKFHESATGFAKTLEIADGMGFKAVSNPKVLASFTALLEAR